MKPQEFRKTLRLVGICTTPFDKDRKFDAKAMSHHVNWMIERGITAENGCLVVSGSCGEGGAMDNSERKQVLDTALEAAKGRVPIVMSCNHSNVYQVIDLAQYAEKAGAAGIMLISPYYYAPTDRVALEFFKMVSANTGLGIYLYNNTYVTQYDISVKVMVELAETTNVVGIKECTPSFFKMMEMCHALKDKIAITSGNGECWEPYTQMEGCTGFISTFVNFAPEYAVRMWKALAAKDYDEATNVRKQMRPLFQGYGKFGSVEGEPKVIALAKKLADWRGAGGGYGRLPIQDLTEEESLEAKNILIETGLL